MTVREEGDALFRMMVNTASGVFRPAAERYGIHNDLCVFNPAPIT